MDSSTSSSETRPGFVSRYVAAFLIGLVVWGIAQMQAMRMLEGNWGKGESNFFSSLARVQNAAERPARVALVGSSITGRLPDRSSGFPEVVNVGIDGGSALDGLRAIDQGVIQVTDEVVIEINTLSVGLHAEGVQVAGSLSSPWFRAGLKFPAFAYRARPTGMFYSWARNRGTRPKPEDGGVLKEGFGLPAEPDRFQVPQFGPEEAARIDQISNLVLRAKSRGLKVTLVQYPPAKDEESVHFSMARVIAQRCKVPVWNLGDQIRPEAVEFTDAVHLTGGSAAEVLKVLIDVLDLPAG